MVLLCHLPIGVAVTYWVFRQTWSTLRLEIGASHFVSRGWPFKPARMEHNEVSDVLITQRVFEDSDKVLQAEWILSVRLRTQLSYDLFSHFSGAGDATPKAVDQLATHVAHALARPITREVRDERKG